MNSEFIFHFLDCDCLSNIIYLSNLVKGFNIN